MKALLESCKGSIVLVLLSISNKNGVMECKILYTGESLVLNSSV